jgi:hypothetical protein
MPQICVLNQSGADDADVAFAVKACDQQLRLDFCPLYPAVDYQPVSFFATKEDLPTFDGTSLLAIVMDTIDVEGAAAYHGLIGSPFIRIDRNDGELSVLMSHEILEESADPTCTLQRTLQDGRQVAFEVCDPVQGWTYPMAVSILGETRQVMVSAFVTGAWFNGGPGRKSVNGTTADLGRGELAPGGYLPTIFAAEAMATRIPRPASWGHVYGPRADKESIVRRALRQGSRFARRSLCLK